MKLTPSQIESELTQMSGWSHSAAGIAKRFSFGSYADGAAFALKVMLLAEKTDHHPDALTVGWQWVNVLYTTHSVGGVSHLDIQAAKAVDALAKQG